MILCYVNDLLVTAEDKILLSLLKNKLAKKLPTNDIGLSTDFLGVKIAHGKRKVNLLQNKYAEALIKSMGISKCSGAFFPCDKSLDLSTPSEEAADNDFPYRSIMGSLLYIAAHTSPEIAAATRMLARHV